MTYELVMYGRSWGCPFITLAKRVLADYHVAYREILIDRDGEAKQRVLGWTGFLSVPTLVVAQPGDILPYEPPAPLPAGSSPRGIDRGTMITEPGQDELIRWLQRHGFIEVIAAG
ncbi:MAG: glutaredoxin family protein [Anaerolineae bacterium]|nr:glutaredoxin family protein [Anaerolineae bacterium]